MGIVKQLLAAGANANIKNSRGENAFALADAENSRGERYRPLVKRRNQISKMLVAHARKAQHSAKTAKGVKASTTPAHAVDLGALSSISQHQQSKATHELDTSAEMSLAFWASWCVLALLSGMAALGTCAVSRRRSLGRVAEAVAAVLVVSGFAIAHYGQSIEGVRVMSPPDSIPWSREDMMDSVSDSDLGQLHLHLMTAGPERSDQLEKFRTIDSLDVFGPYEEVKNTSGHYYRSLSDKEVLLWHYPPNHAWYVGPADNFGSNFGMLQVPGTARGPKRNGWQVALANTRWAHVDVWADNAEQLQMRVRSGARRLSVPMLSTTGDIHMSECKVMKLFHHDRPTYTCKGAEAGYDAGLWWNDDLESWCTGPMLEAQKKRTKDGSRKLDLMSLESWPYCFLRAHDPSLLPEWITTPWIGLAQQWLRYDGDQQVSFKLGVLRVGRHTLSMRMIKERVLQLPAQSGVPPHLLLYLRLLATTAAIVCTASWWMRQLPRVPRPQRRAVLTLRERFLAEAQLWLQVLELAPVQGLAEPARRGRRRVGRGRGQPATTAETAVERSDQRRGQSTTTAETAVEPSDQPQWWVDLEPFHVELERAAGTCQSDFICPLTHEIMRVPTMLADGDEAHNVYEHDALVTWLREKSSDPLTGQEITPSRRKLIRDQRRQREIRDWCETRALMWRQELAARPASTAGASRTRSVHVFIDHSNAAIGATSAGSQLRPRQLAKHVEAGRDVRERVVIGSHEMHATRDEWERLGYVVAADTRRGPERFVDDALHAQLMRTAARRFDPPRTIVLVTGDGNSNEGRTNFPECVEEALKNSWWVELFSWRRSLSQTYAALAREYADQFTICYLEDMQAQEGLTADAPRGAGKGSGGRGGRGGRGNPRSS